jgi:hypothetical protein
MKRLQRPARWPKGATTRRGELASKGIATRPAAGFAEARPGDLKSRRRSATGRADGASSAPLPGSTEADATRRASRRSASPVLFSARRPACGRGLARGG